MLDIAGNRLSYTSDKEFSAGGGGAGALRASCHKNLTRDEFCFQAEVEDEEGHEANSPTLWKNNYNNDDDNSCEFSPLLSCDHQYSNLSRLQVILEARRELMQMIRDMPESSYELSLKDIVDERQKKMEDVYKEEEEDEERSFHFETEAQLKKKQQHQQQKKNNSHKKKMKRMESTGSNKFSRSTSMDSEIFLIKMFSIPSCFGSNKKKNIATHKNGSSKVSPRNSFEIHEDDHHKEPMIRRIFSAGENNNRGKFFSSGIRSNSDSISTSRHVFS